MDPYAGEDYDGKTCTQEVEAFAKQLKVRREPEKDQLDFLAKAKLSRAPQWPIACLKALLECPDKALSKKGEAKLFCGADITLMEGKYAANITEAAGMMNKAKEWFGKQGLTWQPAELSGLLGTFEVRLVHFVHNWKYKTRLTFPTMDAICIDLAKSVRDMGGDMSKCPWTVTDAPAASAQSASKECAIVVYAADGSMSQTSLKDVFGMELGTTVTLKKVP